MVSWICSRSPDVSFLFAHCLPEHSGDLIPAGKRLQKTMERSTMLLMGKSTISTGPSSQTVSHYQRVHGYGSPGSLVTILCFAWFHGCEFLHGYDRH